MYAIIGGSGLAKLTALESPRRQVMRTPYGAPSGALTFGRLGGADVVFLARHGYGHTLAPHEINYRANIWALKELKVDGIVSVATVGGIRADLGPGALALPDQIIDYTHSRKATFFEGSETPVIHVDFTIPYSTPLRAALLAAAARCGEPLIDGGVYACTQGPRLETAAEIERIARDGGDMVGMTGMPEAVLAREAGVAYATLGVVVNHAAGRGTSKEAILLEELDRVLNVSVTRAVRILVAFVGGAYA
ncbi:MAG TPA: S-methyl-5'-thioinosine phosphorylase [Burkholderiaceae bacterium]|nr:S-methyl-5'-thioinosine phosphorylase [Burkholderiaceae bacterium]